MPGRPRLKLVPCSDCVIRTGPSLVDRRHLNFHPMFVPPEVLTGVIVIPDVWAATGLPYPETDRQRPQTAFNQSLLAAVRRLCLIRQVSFLPGA